MRWLRVQECIRSGRCADVVATVARALSVRSVMTGERWLVRAAMPQPNRVHAVLDACSNAYCGDLLALRFRVVSGDHLDVSAGQWSDGEADASSQGVRYVRLEVRSDWTGPGPVPSDAGMGAGEEEVWQLYLGGTNSVRAQLWVFPVPPAPPAGVCTTW